MTLPINLPEESLDVALALWSWGSHGVRKDAVLGLELVAEVAVSVVFSLVPEDSNDRVFVFEFPELWSGGGHHDQAGEEYLCVGGWLVLSPGQEYYYYLGKNIIIF